MKYNLIISTVVIGFKQCLAYRGNFLLSMLAGILALAVNVIFWPALFGTTLSRQASMSSSTIAGYTLKDMLTYALIVYVLNWCITSVSVGNDIKEDIVTGKLSTQMLRPYNYLTTSLIMAVSKQLIFISMSVFLFILLLFRFKSFLVMPKNNDFKYFLIAILISLSISFLISCLVGMASFWLLETNALSVFLRAITIILSGALFPLDFINGFGGIIVRYSPFSYLIFFPTQIYLQSYTFINFFRDMIIGIFWIVLLGSIVKYLWIKGIKGYSSFGG